MRQQLRGDDPARARRHADPDEALARLGGLATSRDLRSAGVSSDRELRRVRSGQWFEVLPGVVSATPALDDAERLRSAIAFAAHPDACLSHLTALTLFGLRPPTSPVHVSIPHGAAARSAGYVRIHQTRSPMRGPQVAGLPVSDLARAVADSAGLLPANDLRQVVIDAVTRAGVLAVDLRCAQRPGAKGGRALREAVDEVELGSRSPGEGLLYRGVVARRLPAPELNGRVETRDGPRFVDLLWRRLRLGVEVDGQRWHLDPVRWRADLARQNALLAEGVVLLRFPAARVFAQCDAVVDEIAEALALRARELRQAP